MAKTPRPSLEELADKLTKRKTPDSSGSLPPPYHDFDVWKRTAQSQLLGHLRHYLKHCPGDVSRALQDRLEVRRVLEPGEGPTRDRQPCYDPLPDKVFFALIEHDSQQWQTDPVILCQINNWQWLLKASPREFFYLRKKLKRIEKCIGKSLVPPEVKGAGNFNQRRERVRKLYYGAESAEWKEEDPETGTVTPWKDKALGVYGWFKDLEQRYKTLPGVERNHNIRMTTLLNALAKDPDWEKILPADRKEALAWLERWLPRKGKSASTLAREYIAEVTGISIGTVDDYIRREERK